MPRLICPTFWGQYKALAREFVKEQVEPRVDGAYQQGRESIGQNMTGVSGGGDNGSVTADYGHNSGRIDAMTQEAGIKDNVEKKVDGMITANNQQHQKTRENIQQQGVEVKKENAELEKGHKTKENNFRERYNKEIDGQRQTLFQETTDKIRNEALSKTNEMKDKY